MLSDFQMALGQAGLELEASGQELEAYHKGKWVAVESDTPICATKGALLAVRRCSVEDLYNWDIDKDLIS
jgi:hypothetical protein